jgi:hypothetical protein
LNIRFAQISFSIPFALAKETPRALPISFAISLSRSLLKDVSECYHFDLNRIITGVLHKDIH